MEHLGDITKISGYTAPIVDCIVGGSPCQDLSVAGKRAGLDGERSGLYIEQVRIVKEMRARDERNGRTGVDVRPRYMVWENVPGAFSSNKGDDFRIVLEEIAKVCDKDAVIPMPDKGKWTNHGCILGNGWSVAWRVLDAQFWGVPQRRRRIALVADFGGQSAPEILFVSKGVSGNTDEGKQKRKAAPSDASGGIGADDRERVYCIEPGAAKRLGGYVWEGLAPTLRTEVGDNRPSVAYGISSYNSNAMKSSNPHSGIYEADTSRTLDLNGGNPSCNQGGIAIVESVPYTLKIRSGCEGGGKGALVQKDKSATLSTLQDQTLFQPVYSVENHPADSRVGINEDGIVQALTSRMGTGGGNVPMVLALDRATYQDKVGALCARDYKGVGSQYVEEDKLVCYSVDQGGGKSACNIAEGQSPTLTCTHGGEPAVCYTIDEKCANTYVWKEQANTLAARDYKQPQTVVAVDCRNGTEDEVNGAIQSSAAHNINSNNVVRTRYIVRRLTPLECERLQGYPDGWTDIGEWTDSKGKTKQSSDAARYKALGNSIALPPWKWVLKRLCACYERDATMASLFDGIGGFPYLWEQLNGKGSCLWASEIEEFPIAVTKVRIGE